MNQTKSVLVGVDFSDGARAALQQAVRLAAQNRATLHVLHVIDAAALSGLAACRVLHEAPLHRSGIAAYAQQQDADLIVLATRSRPRVEAGTLSSTAERLVRELPCSVLVVKPTPDSQE